MLILGIDPGLNVTGYGLVDAQGGRFTLIAAGYIKTHSSQGLPRRLNDIHDNLSTLVRKYRPQAIVLEKIYSHYRHPVTAALLGHARGVICLLAHQSAVEYHEYPATRVKKVTTGNGHASKLQIRRMIEHALGIQAESLGPVDASDAISLAMAHAYIAAVRV